VEIARGAQQRVARALLESGAATVAELADRLELSGAAVRKHLDDMLHAGLVDCADRPPYGPDNRKRGRGRPARFYHLTPEGRDSFETSYEDVAVGALRFLAERDGEDAVMDFARSRVAELEGRYAEQMAGVEEHDDRIDVLADALTSAGYAAVAVPTANGTQLCQHNCPVAHVAEEFPQFCEAETEAFGRLVGTHVMRLATLAHGDGVCTTHIPTAVGLRAEPDATDAPVADRPAGSTEGRTLP
jgi:predicted ArsR family transcriptional regulator